MKKHASLSLLVFCVGCFSSHADVLREDFLETPAHVPIVQQDLVHSEFLTLRRFGKSADQLKRSFHRGKANDPYCLWNGRCDSEGAILFDFSHPLDLSAEDTFLQTRSKNAGKSVIRIALRVGADQWICS